MAKTFVKMEGVRKIANTLSGEAKDFADAVVAAFEEANADENEHDITSLKTKIDEIAANFAKQSQEVAERVARAKAEILAIVNGTGANVKDQFTPKVCEEIIRNLVMARTKEDAIERVLNAAESNGIKVARKNDVSGLSFAQVIDYAILVKQDESDEIFDALYKTNRTRINYAELDQTDADEIAHQWNGITEGVATKLIQDLAVEGKNISTKYIYKRQRVANEDLDSAEAAGALGELEGDVRRELAKAVKALAVKAILIGDAVNADGSKVTVFETIGTKAATDLFTTVVNPTTPNTVTMLDVRKTAEAVKTEKKWAVMSSDLKLQLAAKVYASGGSQFFLSDDELAAQLGVSRIFVKDYIENVNGLHCVIFDPDQYWVNEKKVMDVAFPQYENNTRNYLYEINMGGIVRGLQSSAILAEESGSSN